MLMYFDSGLRNYPRFPVKEISLRHNWEFYGILSGKAAPFFSVSEKLEPVGSVLWLLPPRRCYAWWSKTGKAERMAFHFSSVDESLELLMGNKDFLSVRLDRRGIARLRRIAREVEPQYRNMNFASSLHFNKALAELSIMIAEQHEMQNQVITLSTKNQIHARRALAFFQGQLPRRPLVNEVAEMAGISCTHLRRVFLEVFHEPPKRLFLIAQLERAKQLAGNSDLLINDIGMQSGFKGAPDLCRAFRRYNHTTFHQWRTQIVDLKKRPSVRGEILRQVFGNEASAPQG